MRNYGVALPLGHGDAEASASASTLSRSRHESDSANVRDREWPRGDACSGRGAEHDPFAQRPQCG